MSNILIILSVFCQLILFFFVNIFIKFGNRLGKNGRHLSINYIFPKSNLILLRKKVYGIY